MKKKEPNTTHSDEENDSPNDSNETTQMDIVDDDGEGSDKKAKNDSRETRINEPVDNMEQEPWSVLDMARCFAGAANGSALAVSALLIFIILILATIFRFIGVVIDRSLTDYIFNGLAILVGLFGLSVGSGTLSKIHGGILKTGKRMSISDAMGYMFKHAHNLLLSPLKIIVLTAIVAGAEVGLFYLCRFVPYLYGLLFFPLILLTLILLCMSAVLVIFMNLSPPAVAVGGFKGTGAFEKVHTLFRKKTGRVIIYSAIVFVVVVLMSYIIFFAGKHVFNFQQTYFAGNIFREAPDKGSDTVPRQRGYDYYDAAFTFLKKYDTDTSITGDLKKEELSRLKGALFLISMYITISIFFSYVLSLYSSLNTVAYLALSEETAEV